MKLLKLLKNKVFLSAFAVIIILLLFMNYRVPFFLKQGGPWSVGYKFSNRIEKTFSFDKIKIINKDTIKNLKYPIEFMADPFFLYENKTFYIFFEQILKSKEYDNGDIGVLVSKDGINYEYKGVVLNEKFHLSYPQVFKYKNDFYMIPESSGANAVLLYKAKEFPFKWVVSDTLIQNAKYKDPTILITDSLKYLFVSNDNLTLKIFTSKELHGKWKVLNDKLKFGNEIRPGGRIFRDENNWIIPLQNFSDGYGYGLSLYKITINQQDVELERYKELYLCKNESIPQFNYGMHHLDIQKVNSTYYKVFDGNTKLSDDVTFNPFYSLKINCYDFYNFIVN